MNIVEHKKMALMLIKEVLEKYSDPQHPMTQASIISKLRSMGLVLERKALGRNIELLKQAGCDIESTKKGSYINTRLFEDVELKYLVDAVLSAEYLPQNHSMDLIDKLASLSSVYFKKNIESVKQIGVLNKTDNKSIFYTIDLLLEAIREKKSVRFCFNRYNRELKLEPKKTHDIMPYQLILKKHQYYLIGFADGEEAFRSFRIDRITNIEIMDSYTGAGVTDASPLDYKALASSPYLFMDKPENVILETDESVLDQIIDWFGRENIIVTGSESKCRVSIKCSLKAMEYWAMQYLNSVEVISPDSLRSRIRENLRSGFEKYDS